MQRKLFEVLSPKPGKSEVLAGNFTIGAGGAITAQTGARQSGVTVTQDTTGGAVGRYLLTFYRGFTKGPQAKMAIMEGPATGTAFPTATGSEARFRSYASPTAAASLQLLRSDTQADADGASGTVVHFILVF